MHINNLFLEEKWLLTIALSTIPLEELVLVFGFQQGQEE